MVFTWVSELEAAVGIYFVHSFPGHSQQCGPSFWLRGIPTWQDVCLRWKVLECMRRC